MKTHYFSDFRRGAQTALFLVLGGIFLALGIVELVFINKIWGGIFTAAGALIAAVPQFYIHAGYTFHGGAVRCNRGFFRFAEFRAEEIPALLITVYDAYRQWKGFKPVYTAVNGERRAVPALLILREANERDLELCDTRCNAKICTKKALLAEMYLNFRFLRQLLEGGFCGKIYIYEPIYLAYKEQFDALLEGAVKENAVVFRRLGAKSGEKR